MRQILITKTPGTKQSRDNKERDLYIVSRTDTKAQQLWLSKEALEKMIKNFKSYGYQVLFEDKTK